ncbi:MAG: polysaccharide biosynthesis tyrosine autokinase [Phycisphaerales bacterium JB037]
MTTAARPAAPTAPGPARPAAAGPTGGASAPSLDPIRLLRKYKLVLIAAMILGVVVGVASYFVWLRYFPSYKSFALFQIEAPRTEAGERFEGVDEQELELFMETQTRYMTSRGVLQLVAQRPTLAQDVPNWSKQFISGGAIDSKAALRSLEDDIRARILGGTIIELSATAGDKADATALVRLVREEYLSQLSLQSLSEVNKQIDAIRRQIELTNNAIKGAKDSRRSQLVDQGVESLDGRTNEAIQALANINTQIADVALATEASQTRLSRLEAASKAPNGPQYDGELRAQVQQQPTLVNMRQQMTNIKTEQMSLQAQGFGVNHRNFRRLQDQLEALEAQYQTRLEQELQSAFQGQLDNARNTIDALAAQAADLESRRENLKAELNRLTVIQTVVADFDDEIKRNQVTLAELERTLNNLEALKEQGLEAQGGTDIYGRARFLERVRLLQQEQLPDEPAQPQMLIVVPAGFVIIVGLVGTLIVLRELLDQRVKGPGDIALIPRTRVIGMIPQMDEDPGKAKAIETIVRDRPAGVLAEQFRSVRTTVVKRMQQMGHRSLLITGGLPNAGTTTVGLNLAFACAATDMRVLLIDANFRRPRIHRVLGLEDRGLGQVLAGEASLEEAVQPTDIEGLVVLAAGGKDPRAIDRLGTGAMDEVLANAAASYDLVIIDAAPMVVSGDALSLANKCDCSLLVVRALSEKRGMVARLKADLAEARGEFLGVLVNGVRSAAGGYLKFNIRTAHKYQSSGR